MRAKLSTVLALLAQLGLPAIALGQTPPSSIKIGVLTDMSGSASDATGMGSVIAARLAVDDYGPALFGSATRIEIINADHQNKPDVASSIARQWINTEGVNAIADVTNSSAALAVNEVMRGSHAVMLGSGVGTTEITGPKCSPNTIQWTYDTYSIGTSTARAVLQKGGKTWFFVTADFAFGHSLEADAARVVQAEGGKVLGSVRHPAYASADFSSYLLQAQASGAEVIGLANSVTDTINTIKTARAFGIGSKQQSLAALIMLITDVHSLGLEAAQGTYLTEPFYWDLNDGTRAFSKRFAAQMNGKVPTMIQAGVYGAVAHYLKAVKAAGTTEGETVVREMKTLPTDDPLFGKGIIRADGRKIHNMYLFQVKAPADSTGPWDYYRLIATVPGDQAFKPLAEGGCPLASH